MESQPYEEGEVPGSSVSVSSETGGAPRRGQANGGGELWNAEEEQYYGQRNSDAGSTHGRWHYPANFEDTTAPPGSLKKKKKSVKKDRWARAEDAYSINEENQRKKKKKKKISRSAGVGDDDSYSRRSFSTTDEPEDAEGAPYGDRRPAGAANGNGAAQTDDDQIFTHQF